MAFEQEEDLRRRTQRHDASAELMDWAASTLMGTPVSALPRAPFVQRQLSPIPSEEEYTYDSAAERQGLDRASYPPPYNADTELADYTARSAKRGAAEIGEGGEDAPSRAADAEGSPGGAIPPSCAAGPTVREEESPDAPPTRLSADEFRAFQEAIRAEHAFRSPARRQPDPAHHTSGSDGES